MNALDMARTAYTSSAAPIRTHRSTEYEAFARITHRLYAAVRAGKGHFSELVAALYDNHRLWTALAADVSDRENELPPDLRARILYLAEFTQDYTGRVLRKQADPIVLVEINAAVMRGLGGNRVAAP